MLGGCSGEGVGELGGKVAWRGDGLCGLSGGWSEDIRVWISLGCFHGERDVGGGRMTGRVWFGEVAGGWWGAEVAASWVGGTAAVGVSWAVRALASRHGWVMAWGVDREVKGVGPLKVGLWRGEGVRHGVVYEGGDGRWG
ncbi:hypothetical protein Tco_0672395 [Tanacetum coccineum]